MAQALRQQIASLVLRRASAQPVTKIAPRRNFSSSAQHDDAEEMAKWRSLTGAGFVLCTGLGIYNFTGGHEEFEERKEYSYMHIRNKEFPWGPDGLFEYKHEHEH